MTPLRCVGRYSREDVWAYLDIAGYRRADHTAAVAVGVVIAAAVWLAVGQPQLGLITVAVVTAVWAAQHARHRRLSGDAYVAHALERGRGIDVTIDDAGVTYVEPHVTHTYSWSAFDDFTESIAFFTIRGRGDDLIHLPKSILPPADQDALRAVLIERLRPADDATPTHAFPVILKDDVADAR